MEQLAPVLFIHPSATLKSRQRVVTNARQDRLNFNRTNQDSRSWCFGRPLMLDASNRLGEDMHKLP